MSKKGAERLDRTSKDARHWAECFCEQCGFDDEVASNLHTWFANYWAAVNDPLQAEVKRLTDENNAMREQLRYRQWPDEKPTESDEYLVEQWLEVKWAKDLNCKLFSVLDWHNGKWVKPSGEVMCWLPIPQGGDKDE